MLLSCAPTSAPPVQQEPRDPTAEPWYGQSVGELTAMNVQAKALVNRGRSDEAAAIIQKGEALSGRLISVPRPTLAAVEAAADVDQLYGEMLLANRNYGW